MKQNFLKELMMEKPQESTDKLLKVVEDSKETSEEGEKELKGAAVFVGKQLKEVERVEGITRRY